MKLLNYFKYFFFIGFNWNFRLAFFTLHNEINGEKKYQVDSIEIDWLKTLTVRGENKRHASIYQAANYFLLEKAFEYLKEKNIKGSLVDFGSGKGRILAVAAFYDFQKITGIDFAPALCAIAKGNVKKLQNDFPQTTFSIICDDAIHYSIKKDDAVFFFFNPFDETIMLKVLKNILQSLKENPREIWVAYINPLYKEIFLSAGFIEEYYLMKMKYLELSILNFHPQED
ncbi:MAG: class I SAM-dependent methyltransferase [Bacteroidota bacterium]|nr:class I SAM-dependent methyltransferase [Bacteroidota bacterium]